MVNLQYPHTIRYNAAPTPASQDENGHWVTSATDPINWAMACRAEPNDSAGRTVVSADGQQQEYGFIVYLSSYAPDIKAGTSVVVSNGESIVASGTVKRFHRGLMNVRLWV